MKPTNTLRVTRLVGTNYCGSTLMALLMDSHPQIASIGESLNRKVQTKGAKGYPCSCGEMLLDCFFWKQVIQSINVKGIHFSPQQWTDHKYKNEWLHKMLSTYYSNPVAEFFRSLAASMLPIHRNRVQAFNRVNVAFMETILNITRKEVIFDSSKNLMRLYYLLRIPELDVRIIRIVRDVRAFVESYKRRGSTIEKAVKIWKKYQLDADNVMRMIPSNKICVIKYEDLCKDQKYWLQYIYKFLGVEILEPRGPIIPKEHHVIGNRIRLKSKLTVRLDEKWKTILTEQEISLVNQFAGELNARFGYT